MDGVPLEYREYDFTGLNPAEEMHWRDRVMLHLHVRRQVTKQDNAGSIAAAERALAEDIEAIARLRRGERD